MKFIIIIIIINVIIIIIIIIINVIIIIVINFTLIPNQRHEFSRIILIKKLQLNPCLSCKNW